MTNQIKYLSPTQLSLSLPNFQPSSTLSLTPAYIFIYTYKYIVIDIIIITVTITTVTIIIIISNCTIIIVTISARNDIIRPGTLFVKYIIFNSKY